MNCLSSSPIRTLLLACLATVVACGAPASEQNADEKPLVYDVRYTVAAEPDSHRVTVTLRLQQSRRLLRELSFALRDGISIVGGDGTVATEDGQLRWQPPAAGGELRWQADVQHRRNGDGYDAWLHPDWGLFRAEDVIPRAATRTLKGASSRTELRFDLPASWSVVTEYSERDSRFLISNAERRFDEPTGWIVMGKLGVRRETIAGVRVAVAAPVGQSQRRLDTLALLNWTLPELARLLPSLPARLTIVSAGDPMWRGGLSAPQSLFLHADRPLLSENATSTLLHEVMHLALGIDAVAGEDWIVEGLAEFYSLELLKRSGTISRRRFDAALADQRDWASDAKRLCQAESSGAVTALAVTLMADLDAEIRKTSESQATLDDVVRRLVRLNRPLQIADFQFAVSAVQGKKSDLLDVGNLDGCRSMAS